MRVTATEGKNRSRSLCAHAKCEHVFVEKAGQLDSVILAAEQYQASTAARKQAFEAEVGDWITAQNDRVEALGIPSADLLPW